MAQKPHSWNLPEVCPRRCLGELLTRGRNCRWELLGDCRVLPAAMYHRRSVLGSLAVLWEPSKLLDQNQEAPSFLRSLPKRFTSCQLTKENYLRGSDPFSESMQKGRIWSWQAVCRQRTQRLRSTDSHDIRSEKSHVCCQEDYTVHFRLGLSCTTNTVFLSWLGIDEILLLIY